MSSEHIRRPMNAFIVWSREKRRDVSSENPRMHNSEISKLLGHGWRKLTQAERQPYIAEAQRLARLHKEKYPNYKYKPRRKKQARGCELPATVSQQQTNSYFEDPCLYLGSSRIPVNMEDRVPTDIADPGLWKPASIFWDMRNGHFSHSVCPSEARSLCTCMDVVPPVYYFGPQCLPDCVTTFLELRTRTSAEAAAWTSTDIDVLMI